MYKRKKYEVSILYLFLSNAEFSGKIVVFIKIDIHMTNSYIASDLPVLVIGAAGMDMVGRLKSELRPHTSNPAQIRYSFGGAARNIAENLLNLGTSVNLLTVVGSDEAGENLIQAIGEAGANVDAILRSSQYPTGTYLAVINTDGTLEYGLDDMRILAELSPKYIRAHEDLFTQSSMVFFDLNLSKETLRTIMSIARKEKLPVCADPTSEALAPKLSPYLDQMRLVVPNRGEASILCQSEKQHQYSKGSH